MFPRTISWFVVMLQLLLMASAPFVEARAIAARASGNGTEATVAQEFLADTDISPVVRIIAALPRLLPRIFGASAPGYPAARTSIVHANDAPCFLASFRRATFLRHAELLI